MPILIPNINLVRPTTTPARRKPGQVKTAMKNPGPVKISATGATGSGAPLCERCVTAAGFYGFNLRTDAPAGAADDEAFGIVTGCIVDGFTGVTPDALVYVATAAAPAPEADFSGLTHTAPVLATIDATWLAVGVGVTPTKIDFFAK